jgi:serine/threonine-protein kinase
MSPDRWQRVEELFFAALDHAPVERDAYLTLQCGDDPELRSQVDALIASSEQPSDFLERAVAEGIPDGGLLEGRRIGPYVVEREIGAGGMGTVLLAERADEQFRQQVAIKVLAGRWASQGVIERFRAERQILAGLNHPGIARLLDGGIAEDGLPYLVMEYVEGVAITEYARSRGLAERLRLFRQVCSAVSYAHQNLIVHRDLKPSNILVTAGGEPKLLDFGIAKVLDTQQAGGITRATERLLTPEYASPEQVRGEPVSTATDVYSLGVLLYEMVTGARPFTLRTATPLEVERVICETEAETPSRRLRSVDRDLDNIILMAMRKEPARRYHSVEALSEDIRRYLEGYPVAARADRWQYRAGKFVKRNRLAVAAAALFLVTVVVFGVRLAAERDAATRERVKAEAVSRFLVESFELANPLEGPREYTAREVAERGVERIREQLSDQPQVRATALVTLGRAMQGIGRYQEAGALFTESLALQREVYGPQSLEVAETMLLQGKVTLERGAGAAGQRQAVESQVREAVEIRRKRLGAESVEHALALDVLAEYRQLQGQYEEAETLYRESIRILTARGGAQSQLLMGPTGHLGILYAQRRDFAQAEPLLRQTLELQRPLKKNNVLLAVANLGAVQAALGKPEAEALLREALEGQTKLLGPEHPAVASTLVNTANFLKEHRGENREAAQLYERALAIRRKRLGGQHPAVALVLVNLGAVRSAEGDVAGAEAAYREALAIRKAGLGAQHPLYAKTLYEFANLLARSKRMEEAEQSARAAVAILWPQEKVAQRELAEALYALAGVLRETRRGADAEPLLRESLERFRAVNASGAELAPVMGALSRVLLAEGHAEEAEALLRDATAACLEMKAAQSGLLRAAVSEIAMAHRSQGRQAASKELLARFQAKGDARLTAIVEPLLR